MIAVVYVAACLLCCGSVVLLHIVPRARQELRRLVVSLAELHAAALTDDEKELRAQRAAFEAIGGAARLFLRIAGAAGATLLPVWLADVQGVVTAGEVARFALRPDVLIATTVIASGVAVALRLGSRAAN